MGRPASRRWRQTRSFYWRGAWSSDPDIRRASRAFVRSTWWHKLTGHDKAFLTRVPRYLLKPPGP